MQWNADKNDLATIRTNIGRNSKPLRKLISAPEFEKLFGKAKAGNGRSNIFGRDECDGLAVDASDLAASSRTRPRA